MAQEAGRLRRNSLRVFGTLLRNGDRLRASAIHGVGDGYVVDLSGQGREQVNLRQAS